MRVIVLTMFFFIALGIGATCRNPGIVAADCTSGSDCLTTRDAAD